MTHADALRNRPSAGPLLAALAALAAAWACGGGEDGAPTPGPTSASPEAAEASGTTPEPARPVTASVAAAPPRLVVMYVACTVNRAFLAPYDGSVRYTPKLAAFGREGLVFERHVTECGQSGVDFATLFTGTQAPTHGIYDHPNHLGEESDLIAESFAAAGWETHYWSGHPMASPYLGYAQGVDDQRVHGHQTVFQNTSRVFSRKTMRKLAASDDDFGALLERLREDPDLRAYVQVAFTITHEPYHRYAPLETVLEFLTRFPEAGPGVTRAELEHWLPVYEEHRFGLNWDLEATAEELGLGPQEIARLAAVLQAVYAATISQLDGFFGRFVYAVDKAGLGDESVLAFTTDHGESMYRENALFHWTHGPQLAPEVLDVPLLVRGAGLRGTYTGVTRSIDLFPTLAGLAGVPIPASVEGTNLAPALRGEAPPPAQLAFSHTPLWPEAQIARFRKYARVHGVLPRREAELMAVRVREGDLVVKIARTPAGELVHEAYDLAADPRETRNVFDPTNRRHSELVGLLQAYKQRLVDGFDPAGSIMDEADQLEQLRALGYAK